jgi:hypothetical protein
MLTLGVFPKLTDAQVKNLSLAKKVYEAPVDSKSTKGFRTYLRIRQEYRG